MQFRDPEERALWETMCAPAARTLDVLEQKPITPGMISDLYALRGAAMSDHDAFRNAALWSKVGSWVAAQTMLAQSECSGCLGKDRSMVAQELALCAHLAFGTTMTELAIVEQVATTLGATWVALERGELTYAHVKALARVTQRCTPRVASYVEQRLVPVAIEREWTPAELARAARKAVIEADPDGAVERAVQAKADADVRLFADEDEMATLLAYGPAPTLQQVRDRIDGRARQLKDAGDSRNLGQLRVAALQEAVLGGDVTAWPPVRTDVTLDLPSYLGLTRRPGELAGYGPITAETARELSADAQLRRLITDPVAGTVIDVGRRRYRPSRRQHEVVTAAHRICAMPGCCRPASDCDADHRVDWAEGGATSTANLQPLCRRHHNLKTKRFWRVDQQPDGSEIWTSPLGYCYRKRYPDYPVGLIEPQPEDEDLPEEVANRLPDTDPDPPWAVDYDGIPLPDPPPLTAEELEDFEHALALLACFGTNFIDYANTHYDYARTLALVP
jgi:hypothetical protein